MTFFSRKYLGCTFYNWYITLLLWNHLECFVIILVFLDSSNLLDSFWILLEYFGILWNPLESLAVIGVSWVPFVLRVFTALFMVDSWYGCWSFQRVVQKTAKNLIVLKWCMYLLFFSACPWICQYLIDAYELSKLRPLIIAYLLMTHIR